jgi:hypothetical protein
MLTFALLFYFIDKAITFANNPTLLDPFRAKASELLTRAGPHGLPSPIHPLFSPMTFVSALESGVRGAWTQRVCEEVGVVGKDVVVSRRDVMDKVWQRLLAVEEDTQSAGDADTRQQRNKDEL